VEPNEWGIIIRGNECRFIIYLSLERSRKRDSTGGSTVHDPGFGWDLTIDGGTMPNSPGKVLSNPVDDVHLESISMKSVGYFAAGYFSPFGERQSKAAHL